MRRAIAITLSLATLFGLIAFTGSSSSPVIAQSGAEATISALQTRVADLQATVDARGAKINAQRTQIAELKNRVPTETPEATDEIITLNGYGASVTDKFTLKPGKYKVTATVNVESGFDGFIVHVYGPGGADTMDSYVMNEIIDQYGVWTASAVFNARGPGEYFAEISNTSSAWSITLERL